MEETKSAITVYGAYWCPDCRVSKQFSPANTGFLTLGWTSNKIRPVSSLVLEKNHGKTHHPNDRVCDGSILVSHPMPNWPPSSG